MRRSEEPRVNCGFYDEHYRKDGQRYEPNKRAIKRYENKMVSETYQAYLSGEHEALAGGSMKANPYPPGVRHDEWNRGYKSYPGRPAYCGGDYYVH